ncbi:DUF3298 and DUF4163 domain-containing protein [Antarcticibacterium arcticum]|uniref:DUF3298 and DUF4163 domain-containing protein n=1 Tax=Antarcticibacterium arcticum TaxID=2585771 RepID=A0A5B8YKN9_9FLAO|nr:DUF3298 and DUF4163 domain-containing protein [Antarcticibacterium arcticum]QED38550.1 DUF3298 and DUF4163 domain-containing protein [Antarcticibacterium arcticum]
MYLYPEFNIAFTVKKLVSPLILLLFLAGCQKDTPAPEFEALIIDEVSDRDCDPDEENCAYISLNIPWVAGTGARNKSINRNIEQHVINILDYQEENNFSSLESLSQTFIDNYETSAMEFPEYNIPWEASVEGRVLTNTPEIISLEFNLAIFTGGAHGFSSRSYINLNPQTGEILKNEDLFTADFKEYAEGVFRVKKEIPEGESINSTGYFFENDSFYLPQNIGFLKNKIILRYNAYEVASYSEGGIQIEIPREEATDFFKFL